MKRLLPILPVVLLVIPAMLTAQRPKPVFDPETKDGLLIQHIQQEADPTEKLHYMEQFAVQYPSHPAAAWVYDQMQPAYVKLKDWDQVMRIGEKRLAIEPYNLDAAKLALHAAESKHDFTDLSKWADRTWQISTRLAAQGGAQAGDAQQTQLYAEYTFYSMAVQTADLKTRLQMLNALEQRNPKSPYVENLPADTFNIYKQMGDLTSAMALAEKTLEKDPDNVEMLMAVAEFHFRREDSREKVITFTTRAEELLPRKASPPTLSQAEWEKKKAQMLGDAYYMGGISSSQLLQWGRADQLLRASLPYIKDDPAKEATALYHLGIANYKMAENSPARAQDALRFTRLCAAIKSSYQAQAIKNVEAIRAEYNLP